MLVECSHALRRPWLGAAPPNPPEFGRYYGKGMRIDYVLVQRAMRARLVRTAMCCLCLSRFGVTEEEMTGLLHLEPHWPPPPAQYSRHL